MARKPKVEKVDKKIAKKIAEKKSLAGKIRELNDVEIQKKINDLKQELFNLRFQAEVGKLENTAQLKKVKKEIANTIDCIFTGHFTAPSKEYEGKEIDTWKYWEDMKTGEKIEGALAKDFYKGNPIIPVTKPYFYGWAGSLEIGLVKGDKVVPIGYLSGLTDDIKSRPLDFKGKVIEISCMEILPTGGLRHAKFIQFRNDLTIRDATWEKVFG